MADPNRKLDDWTDAARTATSVGDAILDVAAAEDHRLLALHEALHAPPPGSTTPDLVPIVMARIARRAASVTTTAAADAPSAAGAAGAAVGMPAGGRLDRLRDFLSHLTLGPVAAVGSLAAVLAFALWSVGDDAAASALSGAAAGVAVPLLAVVALLALAVGLGALWLRRR